MAVLLMVLMAVLLMALLLTAVVSALPVEEPVVSLLSISSSPVQNVQLLFLGVLIICAVVMDMCACYGHVRLLWTCALVATMCVSTCVLPIYALCLPTCFMLFTADDFGIQITHGIYHPP
eukprot:GHVS01060976.1.p1 GENE.GHVS01060976.1~~GHVS01060976.1.p1  ORF type:complete len:120 (+),score=27.74 GHVS01060976.1:389-748(+)